MVSHLDRDIVIACPLPQAATRLRHYLHEHGNADGDTVRLDVGVDVPMPGSHAAVAVKRSVIATIQPHHLSADMAPRYRVQWAPELPGPLPLFAGELLVGGNNDFDSFSLRLHGTYSPPLGIFGKGFDVAVGNRIAQATVENPLQHVKAAIETQFLADEARKAARRT